MQECTKLLLVVMKKNFRKPAHKRTRELPPFFTIVLLLFLSFSSRYSVTTAFRAPWTSPRSVAGKMTLSTETPSAASASSASPFVKPSERVVCENLPIVYCYDHCPFCVRVRMILGLKNIKHTLHFMANDNIDLPTQLIGKKIAPIFEWQPKRTSKKIVMAESMDIVHFIEEETTFGSPILQPASGRTDLKEWQGSTQNLLRTLQRPRYVATGLLPEFQQLDGRHAYVQNHPLPPYNKDEWKELALQTQLEIYAETISQDPAHDIEELNRKLVELDDRLYSPYHCTDVGLSYDDIDLFSRLRSITLIKGVEWPEKLRSYMDNMAQLTDIPLYDEMAL